MSKTEKQQKRNRDAPIRADTLTPSEKLSAICFAANEFGISYGKYRSIMTVSEEEAIYAKFAERLERQRLHEIELSKNPRKKKG